MCSFTEHPNKTKDTCNGLLRVPKEALVLHGAAELFVLPLRGRVRQEHGQYGHILVALPRPPDAILAHGLGREV